MIKKLRLKFICINMDFITVMLCVIFGMVLFFTRQTMQMQSVRMMQQIAASPMQPGRPGETAEEVRLPFFTVLVSHRGEIIAADGGYFDLSDLELLQQIVTEAYSSDEDTGMLDGYNLRYCKVLTMSGQYIVFADTTTEQATLRNLVYTCLFIGLVSFITFFGISVLLSFWAVKPVEKAWSQQRQFVADASHELKTPLAVIMANAELLQSEDYDEPERSRFSQRILTMSYQMRSLVESLLEMARVDNSANKMTFTLIDFSQLVSDAALSFQLLYEEKGLALRSSIQEDISLKGSESHLFQVMDVLLDNGLKYSAPAGTVNVTLSRHGRNCTLAVASPGEPISKADLKNIFKRFYRIDKARSMTGSYGLGLSIAEAIVKAHSGYIWAESQDGVNTFFVRLPIL